ncbi:trk system potassium uptake protein TrkH [Shimia isoporae]|uniref:Trk system potassium uptake protein TrkH n=1 Tax=Shimia isoporae TaxID=647720 RepID=A0A4R1NW32_9RHOB|nr:potassium transporter TrkG [Shimia isoporae]TCL09332.1 trk system potassium uptake protein TrkH [Shimia isoporae]
MTSRDLKLPLFLYLVAVSGVAMYAPAIVASVQRFHFIARMFFYSGTLVLFVCALIALALAGTQRFTRTVDNLRALFFGFTILPAILAIPYYEAMGSITFVEAYFEMVSSLTTTGASVIKYPAAVPDAIHLWRGLVGWLGGLLMWVAASAIFAPLALGGYEVTALGEPGQATTGRGQMQRADPMKRWVRSLQILLPIYIGLTFALGLMLVVLGERPLSAVMNAMATMSTSGITTAFGVSEGLAGIGGEVVIFLFLLFALSRATFSADTGNVRRANLWHDPELRLGFLIVVIVPSFLFLRHWGTALNDGSMNDVVSAAKAAWGGLFTVLSFLTTTGFESAQWSVAQEWSGLGTPGFILMSLALVGGGVATTAGGVKLLRVYALYLQGLGEMERLVHPSVVIGNRKVGRRRIRRRGAVIAWVFFMLFAMSLAAITMTLAALGSSFEDALVLAISALTTTGPLTQVAADTPIDLFELNAAHKMVLCVAMVLGRLETLAIIALLSPDLWQK